MKKYGKEVVIVLLFALACAALFLLSGETFTLLSDATADRLLQETLARAVTFALLLPVHPSAEGLFASAAPAPWDGYPLDEPDAVLADGDILQGGRDARADVALSALCAVTWHQDEGFRHDFS